MILLDFFREDSFLPESEGLSVSSALVAKRTNAGILRDAQIASNALTLSFEDLEGFIRRYSASVIVTNNKLYVGNIQATNVVYVNGLGGQNSNLNIYIGSTQVWG